LLPTLLFSKGYKNIRFPCFKAINMIANYLPLNLPVRIFFLIVIFISISFSSCTSDTKLAGNHLEEWVLTEQVDSIPSNGILYRMTHLSLPSSLGRHVTSSTHRGEWGESYHLYRYALLAFDGTTCKKISIEKNYSPEQNLRILPIRDHMLGFVNVNLNSKSRNNYKRFHVLDMISGEFTSHNDFFNRTPLSNQNLKRLFATQNGTLYIGSDTMGIFTYNNQKITKVPFTRDYQLLGLTDTLIIAAEKREGSIKRLLIMNDKGNTLSSLSTAQADLVFYKSTDQCLYLKQRRTDKIYCYSIKEGIFDTSSVVSIPSSFQFRFVDSKNLYLANPTDSTYSLLNKNGISPSSLLSSIYKKIAPDQIEVIQPGMHGAGKKWYVTSKGFLKIERLDTVGLKNEVSFNKVNGFSSRTLRFSDDSSLLASSYSGLQEINITDFPDNVRVRKSNSSFAKCVGNFPVYYYRDSIIEIGVKGGHGIFHKSNASDSCSFIESPIAYQSELYGFHPLPDSAFLVGGKTGLFKWTTNETNSTSIVHMIEGPDTLPSISVNRIESLFGSDTLVISAQEGFFIGKWDSSQASIDVLHKYTSIQVNDFLSLPDQSIMIATPQQGVIWLDPAPDFKPRYAFNADNHFQSSITNCLEIDKNGRVWVSTNWGLYLIDVDQRQVYNFNGYPSLSKREFNHSSSAKNSQGLISFGGIDGVTLIDPQSFSVENRLVDTVATMGLLSLTGDKFSWKDQEKGQPFELMSDASEIKPISSAPLNNPDLKLFYKPINSTYSFWQESSDGFIPLKDIEDYEGLSIRWISPGGRSFFSSFTFAVKRKENPYYLVLALPFFLILPLILFYTIKQKNNGPSNIAKVQSSQQEETSEGKEKDSPEPTSKQILQDYLDGLRQKELDYYPYAYSETISSHLLQEVTEITLKHMSSPDFSVKLVAQEVNLSTRQLHRKLIDLTGLTPNKYFTFIKVRAAKEMILDNIDERIGNVAMSVGYNNNSYFSKVFCKIYGKKPSEVFADLKQISHSGA